MEAAEMRQRWCEVLERMAAAARTAGREAGDVRLVAVSKLHPADAVRALYEAGQREFGENYVQEAEAKMAVLPPEISWHFIGHLQTNKARNVVGRFSLIHGVDSLKLARSLHDRARAMDLVQDVLVQVNLAGESRKSGILEGDLPPLAEFLAGSAHLQWRGLMLMPPFFDDPERARPWFARLRGLAESLRAGFGLPLPDLSMGMTGDFEAAIEEGATLVRIGTRIFGERDTN
ncbi:YggS family pyridoxal phosphate-dependent enzyme [Desulfomicrobium escambiense]|uniref:YggS family pyridoxal phosphate-dependent enzyme n=1 Tax=Desulfomicrobium escambiense TaxID=29503 RepID=UPI0003F5F2F0|nr:YggS family pyridoxal phosphate-dependent enzyme [Desulfomicrobium escambiense]